YGCLSSVRQSRMAWAQAGPAGGGGGLGGHAAIAVTSVQITKTCVVSSCPPRWRAKRQPGGQPTPRPTFPRHSGASRAPAIPPSLAVRCFFPAQVRAPRRPSRYRVMWLIKASLRNPYMVGALVFFMVFLGIWSLFQVPVDILPAFKTPAVQVMTFFPGM